MQINTIVQKEKDREFDSMMQCNAYPIILLLTSMNKSNPDPNAKPKKETMTFRLVLAPEHSNQPETKKLIMQSQSTISNERPFHLVNSVILAGARLELKRTVWIGVHSRFQGRFHNPNSYYYRFNDPGEQQETGPWSPHDRYLFLKQLLEIGMDYSVGEE